jgi:hypothetical protein
MGNIQKRHSSKHIIIVGLNESQGRHSFIDQSAARGCRIQSIGDVVFGKFVYFSRYIQQQRSSFGIINFSEDFQQFSDFFIRYL